MRSLLYEPRTAGEQLHVIFGSCRAGAGQRGPGMPTCYIAAAASMRTDSQDRRPAAMLSYRTFIRFIIATPIKPLFQLFLLKIYVTVGPKGRHSEGSAIFSHGTTVESWSSRRNILFSLGRGSSSPDPPL